MDFPMLAFFLCVNESDPYHFCIPGFGPFFDPSFPPPCLFQEL